MLWRNSDSESAVLDGHPYKREKLFILGGIHIVGHDQKAWIPFIREKFV